LREPAAPSAANKHPAGQLVAVGAVHVHPFFAQESAVHEAVAVPSQLAGTAAAASTAAVNVQPCTLFAFASATATVAQVVASGVEARVHTPPAAAQRTGLTFVA